MKKVLDTVAKGADHSHMTIAATAGGLDPLAEVVMETAMSDHPVTLAVRELRKAMGLKQEDFAKKWGVPVSIVSQIEAGRKVNPSWETLRKLVINIGCNPSRLFPSPLDKSIGEA